MNKLNRLLKNKDVQVLLENFLSLSSLKVLTYILPLISLPYLSRVIGVEKFGMISFASSIMIFFQAFVDYGFNYTGIRDISRNRDNIDKVNEIFSSILIIRFLFTFISGVILIVLIFTIQSLHEYKLVLFYSFLIIPGNVMLPEWFFQAQEKMKYVAIFNVISKLIFTLLIFLVIQNQEDYVYVPLLTSLGTIVAGIGSVIFIIRNFKVKIKIPSIQVLKSYIISSFDMFTTLIFPNLYTNLSTILVESYWGKAATGVFSAGYKIIGITSSFADVVSRVFYPYLARRLDKHNIYVKLTFIMNLVISLFLFFSADLIIKLLYGPGFEEAKLIVKIMSITPLFLFLMNTYGTNYLVLVNKERILRKIVVYVSIVGSLLAFILIYKYSYLGAAIAISTVWFIRGGLTYFYAQKHKRNEK